MTSYGQAIDQFGLPGINIDMIELTDRSPDKKYARAVQESQAIVFCDCLDPTPSLFLNKVMVVWKWKEGGGIMMIMMLMIAISSDNDSDMIHSVLSPLVVSPYRLIYGSLLTSIHPFIHHPSTASLIVAVPYGRHGAIAGYLEAVT